MTRPPGAPFPPTLKHYQLLRLLGQGGMGLVVDGVDRRDGTRVAVKLLHGHLAAADPSFLERFEREAHVAALLRSPYTVHLLDYGVENGQSFLVMEFIEGEPLSAEIARGALEPSRALRIAGEVARALEEANARGIVHRDIKPENVLLDRDGRVKVTDFGIARSTSGPGLTVTGGFVGTPAYAAPEQIDGQVDHRSDVYALGVTLYAMLTGQPPFRGRTAMDTLFLHRTAPLPTEPLAYLPDTVQNIVRRCLEKDPLDRYQAASELVGALDRARQSLTRTPGAASPSAAPPTVVSPSSVPEPSGQITGAMRGPSLPPPERPPLQPPAVSPPPAAHRAPARRQSNRRGVLFAALAAAIVVAGGVTAFALLSGGDGDDDETDPAGTASETVTATATGAATETPTPGTTPTEATATSAPTGDRLPSVTPPVAASRLQSGSGAIVTAEGVAVNVWRNPSEASSDNEIFETLLASEGVVVVTNSPASSTVHVTEGLVFWRVLVPGTLITGWVKEVIVDGSVRYLEPAETHQVAAGETCASIAADRGVSEEAFMTVNGLDADECQSLPVGNLVVLPSG